MGIKDEFPQLKAALLLRSPFLASLLMRARIILTKKVPQMAVTEDYLILVNEKFIDSLKFEDKVFLLCHQVMHLALKHVNKAGLDPIKWTIAADAVVNRLVADMIHPSSWLNERLITIETVFKLLNKHGVEIDYEDVEKMSAEEIYALLPDDIYSNMQIFLDDISSQSMDGRDSGGGNGQDGEGDGNEEDEVLQAGDNEIYGDGNTDKIRFSPDEKNRIEDAWHHALIKAYMIQKTAGKVPGYMQLTIDRILEARINWRTLLREAIRYGYGRTILSTYKKASRKHEALPGHVRYSVPDVYVLLDTSGSIDRYMLEQFLSEIYAVAKLSTVYVVPWDATVYVPVTARRPSEVITKILSNLRGGGGTVIKDALAYVNTHMKVKDIIVVLTDGEIFDLDEPETQILFDEVATKASVAVFVSAYRVVNIPRWRFVKLSPLDKTAR